MTFFTASAGEVAESLGNSHSSISPFSALAWRTSHIISRAYTLEREKRLHQSEVEESTEVSHRPSLIVLFRVHLTSSNRTKSVNVGTTRSEPLRCPDDLMHLMHLPEAGTDVIAAMNDVVDRARQCLLDACALLDDLAPEGVPTSREVKDDAENSVYYSSSSCIDVVRRTKNNHSCERSGSPDNVEYVQPYASLVYSSEDGMCPTSGDRCRRTGIHISRGGDGNVQEARIMIQFLLGTAFSCPFEPLAKAFQFVIAEELERSPNPFKACHGILNHLIPLDVTETKVDTEGYHGGSKNSFFFVVDGMPCTRCSLVEALSFRNEVFEEVKWYRSPSPAAALPVLVHSLSGDLLEELHVLQEAAESPASTMLPIPTASLHRRRTGRLSSRTRMGQSNFVNKEVSSENDETSGEVSKKKLWEALSRCGFNISRDVSARRRDILYHIFTELGEVPQYYHVLSICPGLLQAHHRTLQYIFFEEGPLPICERLMLAFMAASRQRCEYLVCRFGALLLRFAEKQQFSDARVHSWLLDGPPPKLQVLQTFIAIATHVPWQISDHHIRVAMNAGWSVPSLIQASSIVAETLSLCSFVMGLFIPNDLWASVTLPTPLVSSLSTHSNLGEGYHRSRKSGIDFTRYTGVDNIVSENRIKGSSGNVFTLWSESFNWHEHGGTIMEQYYPGAASLINTEFDAFSALVRELNHHDCVGLTTPEYSPSYAFRSLRLYVQNIMGFSADDYPYNNINKVLRRPAKLIAQSCTMRPETISCFQARLWVQSSGDSCMTSGDVSSLQEPSTHAAEKTRHIENDGMEQQQQLIDSVASHRTPFTLSMPGDVPQRQQQPRQDILQKALHLHEERLIFLLVLATMEARKEGLLALLLHPMWRLLNNM